MTNSKTRKFIIVMFVVLVALFVPINTARADSPKDSLEGKGKYLEYTHCIVYHNTGAIYYATQYKFSTTLIPTVEIKNGEDIIAVKLDYNKIINRIKVIAEASEKSVIFDDSQPNVVQVIDKRYNNKTELYHALGITGDEIDEPLDRHEEFGFVTYITNSKSYLAGGGMDIIKSNIDIVIGAIDFDMSLVELNYCYGTEYSNITSTADKVITKDEMYYHIFTDLNEDSEITLYQRVPNTKNWYGLLIGVSVGVVAISIIGSMIYKKVKRKK